MKYPSYNENTVNKVIKVLKSGRVNYWTGNECKKFESEFSKYIGNKYSVAVSNGSVALEIALRALDLKKGDEIIVTPRSFIISASCVINLQYTPIFADVDSNGNLDFENIKKIYNKNVKAIILVHLNGLSCDLDPIIKFAKKNKIYLIEDCSQAHGAVYKSKSVGSYGDISTWSFCQDKIISTGGEGGMVSTNNKKLWLKIWSIKDHGKNYNKVFNSKHKIGFKWLHEFYGSNYRLTEMQAAIGREQLKTLDKQIETRNSIAELYLNELRDYYEKYKILKTPNFKCSTCPLKKNFKKCKKCLNSFYQLNLYLNKKKITQQKLLNELEKKKINHKAGSCPEIYKEKIFRKLNLYPKKKLENAKLLGETSIVFPINPYRNFKEIKSDIRNIKKIFKKYI